jgi:GNAT superfamily N-acetyltransferase
MSAAFTIRMADARDLSGINALMHASRVYQGEYYRILEGYYVTPDSLEQNQVFLAENDGALLGFYSLIVESEPADLDLLFVSDAAQGLGVGRALFGHMKGIARKCGRITVSIGAHPPSATFYERMGAVRCGVSPPSARVTWTRPLFKLDIVENSDALDA